MTRKQLHRQQLRNHKQCECIDKFLVAVIGFVALLSTTVALGSLLSNWELITFIFGG